MYCIVRMRKTPYSAIIILLAHVVLNIFYIVTKTLFLWTLEFHRAYRLRHKTKSPLKFIIGWARFDEEGGITR
jgi:hypothetical protein